MCRVNGLLVSTSQHPEYSFLFSCSWSEFLACLALPSKPLFKDYTPSELLYRCHCANQSQIAVCVVPYMFKKRYLTDAIWPIMNPKNIETSARLPLKKWNMLFAKIWCCPLFETVALMPKCRIIPSFQGGGSCTLRDTQNSNGGASSPLCCQSWKRTGGARAREDVIPTSKVKFLLALK